MSDKYVAVIQHARELLPSFQKVSALTRYESKGVLYSEILFMLACLAGQPVRRILESGRARGQSTFLLAEALPRCEIISIEYDKNSPDVLVAEERLRNCKNVELLFGDARLELPRLLELGDIVIIDGPKMFLAIRFALKLLMSGKVSHVFIHDVSVGTPERKFLDRFFPKALFSDQRSIAEVTMATDMNVEQMIPREHRFGSFQGAYGYGFTLACLRYDSHKAYWLYLVISYPFDFYERIRNTF